MRRQDEIRLLFPSQDQESQKLLLSELDGYALAFDSEEVFDLLRSALSSPQARVRNQALVTVSYFLPRFVARRMRVAQEEAGLWTEYQNERARPDPAMLEVLRQKREKMRERARDALVPLAETLARRFLKLAPELKPAAQLALSYLGSDPVLDQLGIAVNAAPTDAAALFSWAFAGGAARDPQRLSGHLNRYGPTHSDVLLAASALQQQDLLALVPQLEGRLDGAGTANLAYALSHITGDAALPALEKLVKRTTGWGQVHVLRAAGASGHPHALALIKRVHAHSQAGFVKQQAIRATGGIFAQESISFCLEQVRTADGALAAQALETLVRLRCPREELAAVARPHLDSKHLRLRVNALLMVVGVDSQTLPRGFLDLLEHHDPLPRVEAAFCMGYWPHPACLDALAAMATGDPATAVRQQAIKSLSKHPPGRSFLHLAHIAMTGAASEALTAVRVLARGAQQSEEALKSLLGALPAAIDPARRALLLRGAATLAAPEGDDTLEAILTTDTGSDDPSTLTAALEAWKLIGGPRDKKDRQLVVRQAGHADPGVRGAATVAGFLAGELSLLSRLESRLKDEDGAALAAACETLLELGLVASEVVGPGHALLGGALERATGGQASTMATARYAAKADVLESKAPVRAEGEFDLDDASASGTVPVHKPPADERASGKEKDAILAELAQRYKKPAQKGDVATALQKDTYLVAGAAAGKLSEEPGSQRYIRAVRQAGAFLKMNPILLVPVVVLCGISLIMGKAVVAPSTHTAGSAQAVALHVMHCTGRSTVPGETAPLVPGDVLRFSEKFSLEPSAALRLVTPTGDRIRVNGPSKLTIGKPSSSKSLELTFDDGSVDFVAAASGTLVLKDGRSTVTCEAGSFVAKLTGGKLKVEARVPPVYLQVGSSPKEEVKVGTPRTVD